ncbi:hypothetical protein ACLOJK_040409, partial [Asimina triloba]
PIPSGDPLLLQLAQISITVRNFHGRPSVPSKGRHRPAGRDPLHRSASNLLRPSSKVTPPSNLTARRASDHHHRPIDSCKVDLGQIQHPPADDVQPSSNHISSSNPSAMVAHPPRSQPASIAQRSMLGQHRVRLDPGSDPSKSAMAAVQNPPINTIFYRPSHSNLIATA